MKTWYEHQGRICDEAHTLSTKSVVDVLNRQQAGIERLGNIICDDAKRQVAGGHQAVHDKTEIERLRYIISGALAHSYGPYSAKELLRRVVVILNKTAQVVEGDE